MTRASLLIHEACSAAYALKAPCGRQATSVSNAPSSNSAGSASGITGAGSAAARASTPGMSSAAGRPACSRETSAPICTPSCCSASRMNSWPE
jgi:hypothetical protein